MSMREHFFLLNLVSLQTIKRDFEDRRAPIQEAITDAEAFLKVNRNDLSPQQIQDMQQEIQDLRQYLDQLVVPYLLPALNAVSTNRPSDPIQYLVSLLLTLISPKLCSLRPSIC